jgi:S1-C subfamily serine protease
MEHKYKSSSWKNFFAILGVIFVILFLVGYLDERSNDNILIEKLKAERYNLDKCMLELNTVNNIQDYSLASVKVSECKITLNNIILEIQKENRDNPSREYDAIITDYESFGFYLDALKIISDLANDKTSTFEERIPKINITMALLDEATSSIKELETRYSDTDYFSSNYGTDKGKKMLTDYKEFIMTIKNSLENQLNNLSVEINENLKVEDKIKESIVWIKYEVSGKNEDGSYFENGGTGSGVIVRNEDNKLTVYTNRHVVDCQYSDIRCFQRVSENIQIRTQDGKLHKVNRVSFSKSDIDLAILSIKDLNAKSYSVALYTPDFKVGEKVIAVGYPSYTENVVEFSIQEGKITNIKKVLSQSSGKNFRAIESDAYTYFGSSGGGLFDKQGNLIGINTWGATGQSIAIDFSSISEESFTYCDNGSYFSNGYCQNYCEREQVLSSDGKCYDVCDEYYCKSTVPQVNSQQCSDSTYVLGSDGYCHAACTINSYCPQSSICYRNQCLSCPFGTYLYKDGTCRKYQ